MKRFEYKYIFISRPEDPVIVNIMKQGNPFYEELKPREIAVTIWLTSYKEAKSRFPVEMRKFYDFVRLERTGKKFRSMEHVFSLKWYSFLKRL